MEYVLRFVVSRHGKVQIAEMPKAKMYRDTSLATFLKKPFGKTLLWMITDSGTWKQAMMFAEDYDEVLLRTAEDNDINLVG